MRDDALDALDVTAAFPPIKELVRAMQSLARWSSSHRRLVIALWALLLVASLGTATTLKNRFVNNLTLPNTGAQRAADLLQSRFPAEAGDTDQIVFHTTSGRRLADPAMRHSIEAMLRTVRRLPHVAGIADPYAAGRAISRDGTIGFAAISFDERGDALPADATKRVIATAQAIRTKTLDVELGGSAIEETQRPTLGAATAIGIGAAMVVLFISFGSLFAMGLPIVTALFGLGTSMGLIAALTHVLATPDFASELALLIGLGVGVDYALFVVTRYRDAYRRNGGDVDAAVVEAMNTAGRSIAFAGLTVIIAMLGLFVVGVHLLYGVALATSLTVALVLAASLTLLPAILSLAGRRIGGRGTSRRERAAPGRRGVWTRWVSVVQRRPAVAAVAATAALLALAAPALDLRLAASDASNDRSATTTHRAYELLSRGFGPGFNAPLLLAVRLPDRATSLKPLAAAIARTTGVASVGTPRLNATRDTAAITVFPSSPPQSKETYDLVKHLRSSVIPPAAQAAGMTVYVGGFTASQVDFAHVLSSKLALFIGVVIALSALLLLAVFRSFVIPVIVFAIVFGLSMDYEVFLVSRIHEAWTRGADHTTAIRDGIANTGRVVTAAAAVMVVVFASFAASDNHILKLFGLSLASAVFLDAVVIRSVLLPAVLQLSGRATWAFPAWADRLLPRLAVEPAEAVPEPDPLAEAA